MDKQTLLRCAAAVVARVPGANVSAVESAESWYSGYEAARVICEGRPDVFATIADTDHKLDLERALVLETAIKNSVDPFVAEIIGGLPEARITLPDHTSIVAHSVPRGRQLTDSDLDSVATAKAVGQILAELHTARMSHIAALGVNVYDPDGWAQRLAQQLSTAVAAGGVSVPVRDFFSEAFRQWPDFQPVCLHGDLSELCFFFDGQRITALVGLSNTMIGDPAHDLGWVFAAGSERFSEACMNTYMQTSGVDDSSLVARAQVLALFQPVAWLAYGVKNGDKQIVSDARIMVSEIDLDAIEDAHS